MKRGCMNLIHVMLVGTEWKKVDKERMKNSRYILSLRRSQDGLGHDRCVRDPSVMTSAGLTAGGDKRGPGESA